MLQRAIRSSRYPRPGGSPFVPYVCTFCAHIPKSRAFASTSQHGAKTSPRKSSCRKVEGNAFTINGSVAQNRQKSNGATDQKSEKATEVSHAQFLAGILAYSSHIEISDIGRTNINIRRINTLRHATKRYCGKRALRGAQSAPR
jgi:hypothetical protein